MITSKRVGTRTVFWTDREDERADLIAKRHVVYTATEGQICSDNASKIDNEFLTLLFNLKLIAPEARLIGVQ